MTHTDMLLVLSAVFGCTGFIGAIIANVRIDQLERVKQNDRS